MVFSGTGTAGAYHAGVLRAVVEAGVRIDVVAGRGMGAVTAVFAAVDASARLWDADGAWLGTPPRGLYRWRSAWRAMFGAAIIAGALLLLPVALLAALIAVYPVVLVLSLVSPTIGMLLVQRWFAATAYVVGPAVLTSAVPRLVSTALLVAVGTASALYLRGYWQARAWRRSHGAPWWRVLGAPLDSVAALDWALQAFWRFVRGAASIAQPAADDLGKRYGELLAESLGQPGYRELLMVAHDLDSRRDLVFAHLADPWRKRLIERSHGAGGGDVVDLSGAGRSHIVDALAAALTPPMVAEPRPVRFGADGYWRGETHRLCDRPGAGARLLREVAEAGVTQVVFVSAATPRSRPHELTQPALGPRDRIGESLDSLEVAAFDDAVEAMAGRFSAFFTIRPQHNPVGAFAFSGFRDERSDRQVAIAELLHRGYEDAYRQFLEPIIGASGEQIHGVTLVGPTPATEELPFRPQAL